MWTAENRAYYARSRLRHPTDLTEAEWALVSRLIPPHRRGGNKRTVEMHDASPMAAIVDSQSVKGAEKGGGALTGLATTLERRSRARSATS